MLIFRLNEFASIDDVALFILNVNLDLRTYGFGTGGGAACSTCGVAESVHVTFNCTLFFVLREKVHLCFFMHAHTPCFFLAIEIGDILSQRGLELLESVKLALRIT